MRRPGSYSRAGRGGLARVFFCGIIALQTGAIARANDNAPAKNARRPVARLVSTTRQEIPASARARLVSSLPVKTSHAPDSAAHVAATLSPDERRAFDLVNAEREARGLGALVLDASLMRMARYHSENMAEVGSLDHVDRDGLGLAGRAQLLGLRGWKALGENIAYNQGYEDPTACAVERWMVSVKHRDNILNGGYTHAGLGIARAADGRVFFAQVFMRR